MKNPPLLEHVATDVRTSENNEAMTPSPLTTIAQLLQEGVQDGFLAGTYSGAEGMTVIEGQRSLRLVCIKKEETVQVGSLTLGQWYSTLHSSSNGYSVTHHRVEDGKISFGLMQLRLSDVQSSEIDTQVNEGNVIGLANVLGNLLNINSIQQGCGVHFVRSAGSTAVVNAVQ